MEKPLKCQRALRFWSVTLHPTRRAISVAEIDSLSITLTAMRTDIDNQCVITQGMQSARQFSAEIMGFSICLCDPEGATCGVWLKSWLAGVYITYAGWFCVCSYPFRVVIYSMHVLYQVLEGTVCLQFVMLCVQVCQQHTRSRGFHPICKQLNCLTSHKLSWLGLKYCSKRCK